MHGANHALTAKEIVSHTDDLPTFLTVVIRPYNCTHHYVVSGKQGCVVVVVTIIISVKYCRSHGMKLTYVGCSCATLLKKICFALKCAHQCMFPLKANFTGSNFVVIGKLLHIMFLLPFYCFYF